MPDEEYLKKSLSAKFIYLLKDTKVRSIERGHVSLTHPIISFQEGLIPRNTYHNTLAFRMKIPLVRYQNKRYRAPVKTPEQIAEERRIEEAKTEEEKKKEIKYEECDYPEEGKEDLDIMIVLRKGYNNSDKNKSVQELRQAEEADFYYIDPLNKEDEEDDGIFFGKCSDVDSM